MKILEVNNSLDKSNELFKICSKLNIIFSIVCIITMIRDPYLGFVGAIFNFIVYFFYNIKKFRKISGAIYIYIILTIYFSIPITWICIRNKNFDFTKNFTTPLNNEEYFENIEFSIIYLTISLIAIVFGMIVHASNDNLRVNTNSINTNKWKYRNGVLSLILLFLFITTINYYEVIRQVNYYSNRFNNGDNIIEQSFIVFIFNDAAFQIYFSYIFYRIFNLKEIKSKIIYILVFISYVILALIGSSKAAILTSFIYIFIYPLAINSANKYILWPSKLTLVSLSIISIFIYVFSRAYRQIIGQDNIDFLDSLLNNIILDSNGNIIENSIILIINRLSSSINNYILIFKHFSYDYDIKYSISFIEYLTKSALNLFLPGTPFEEAYFTTANMLPDVLQKNPLYRIGNSSNFWLYANSQSYTFIGFLLITLGPILCLPMLFFFGYLYSYLMDKFKYELMKFWWLFSFTLIFISYGFESALQTSTHFFIAICVMNFSLILIEKFLTLIKISKIHE